MRLLGLKLPSCTCVATFTEAHTQYLPTHVSLARLGTRGGVHGVHGPPSLETSSSAQSVQVPAAVPGFWPAGQTARGNRNTDMEVSRTEPANHRDGTARDRTARDSTSVRLARCLMLGKSKRTCPCNILPQQSLPVSLTACCACRTQI